VGCFFKKTGISSTAVSGHMEIYQHAVQTW